MFKSIRWKLTIYFVLLVVLVQLIGGAIAITSISTYYRNAFKNAVTTVFSDSLKEELTEAANGVSAVSSDAMTVVMEENKEANLNSIKVDTLYVH